MFKRLKIKKGDMVVVTAGEDKGKQARVISVNRANDRVTLEGVNMVTKHRKPSAQNPQGGIAFAPFLEFCEEWKSGVEVELFDVLTINTPVVELRNQYNTVFGSGIQIASANQLPKI